MRKGGGKRSATVKCIRCKEYGHNVKTYKGGLTTKENKKKKATATTLQSTEPRSSRPVTRAYSSQPITRALDLE